MKSSINIGLLGLGTVGIGLVDLIHKNQSILQNRLGCQILVPKAVVKSLTKNRPALVSNIALDQNSAFVLDDPSIDIVIELTGDQQLAYLALTKSLAAGKSFITANKALIAEREVWSLFHQHSAQIGFEASVGGALPIVRVLRDGLCAERIDLIAAIINGTSNYVLSQMAEKQLNFESAVAEAQQKGYAESDPSLDIDGTDSAHKINIIANLAFHQQFEFSSIYKQGITAITSEDLAWANELGYHIKLLGIARRLEAGYSIAVYPAMISSKSMLAQVKDSYNAALIRGELLGDSLIYGQGAGAQPTAVAIASDIAEIVHNQQLNLSCATGKAAKSSYNWPPAKSLDIAKQSCAHYLRLVLQDKVGVLNQVTAVLKKEQINVRQIMQRKNEHNPLGTVDLVIITQPAKNEQIKKALLTIAEHPHLRAKPQHIRIEVDI